ncbi:MAG: ATP synthase F1 subunit gamma [SAR202 cluster bacterium]|nr:ATP synthase F1 subunit gamma [Chloroflexota bacterium]MQG32837.1 ATP synthase F1 subunit gamma [SAR202 cluster bacterium]HCP23841.1 ATP synthase F1 subunit gamma [Dehalococcoidia bacterium]|tara:strand:- start:2058 stop:2921 length:864 start_codon:yes stop_codon:yes gene_type:complete
MPSVRDIRRRIRSVDNTAKVTNAMSLIAASKMRRSQMAVLEGRPYSDKIQQVIANLAAQPTDDEAGSQPLLAQREVEKSTILMISPDRGLCGGLNANLIRAVGNFIVAQEKPIEAIAVGRKSRDFMARSNQDMKATFTDLGETPLLIDTHAISHMVIDSYSSGETDEIYLGYTRFLSTMSQEPVIEKLLPITPAELTSAEAVGYIYEPSNLAVLQDLLPRFVEMQIYHAILESIASEQSARMVAMRAATDNANELSGDLTLVMNKLRQDSITNELLDLIGGQIALEG